jgi:hypothetical protein
MSILVLNSSSSSIKKSLKKLIDEDSQNIGSYWDAIKSGEDPNKYLAGAAGFILPVEYAIKKGNVNAIKSLHTVGAKLGSNLSDLLYEAVREGVSSDFNNKAAGDIMEEKILRKRYGEACVLMVHEKDHFDKESPNRKPIIFYIIESNERALLEFYIHLGLPLYKEYEETNSYQHIIMAPNFDLISAFFIEGGEKINFHAHDKNFNYILHWAAYAEEKIFTMLCNNVTRKYLETKNSKDLSPIDILISLNKIRPLEALGIKVKPTEKELLEIAKKDNISLTTYEYILKGTHIKFAMILDIAHQAASAGLIKYLYKESPNHEILKGLSLGGINTKLGYSINTNYLVAMTGIFADDKEIMAKLLSISIKYGKEECIELLVGLTGDIAALVKDDSVQKEIHESYLSTKEYLAGIGVIKKEDAIPNRRDSELTKDIQYAKALQEKFDSRIESHAMTTIKKATQERGSRNDDDQKDDLPRGSVKYIDRKIVGSTRRKYKYTNDDDSEKDETGNDMDYELARKIQREHEEEEKAKRLNGPNIETRSVTWTRNQDDTEYPSRPARSNTVPKRIDTSDPLARNFTENNGNAASSAPNTQNYMVNRRTLISNAIVRDGVSEEGRGSPTRTVQTAPRRIIPNRGRPENTQNNESSVIDMNKRLGTFGSTRRYINSNRNG